VRWKADNYNNLLEQPTIFYAVALTLAFLNAGSGHNAGLAWAYVALRIAHSLVHALINKVMIRFALFAAASLERIPHERNRKGFRRGRESDSSWPLGGGQQNGTTLFGRPAGSDRCGG
jgi:hypothetical protein